MVGDNLGDGESKRLFLAAFLFFFFSLPFGFQVQSETLLRRGLDF
jgi:hypothetical protein